MKITLTKELLDAAKTARGGYTKAQLALLGVAWPPARGWTAALIGRQVERDVAERLLRGGGRLQEGPIHGLLDGEGLVNWAKRSPTRS